MKKNEYEKMADDDTKPPSEIDEDYFDYGYDQKALDWSNE